MQHKTKILILAAISMALIAIFMTIEVNGNWDYIIPRRITKILAIIATSIAIAISTVIFQTISNNRILTPNVLGLDSLYMLVQTSVVFLFGSTSITMVNKNINFLLSIGMMILFSGILYKVLFSKEKQNIYFILLTGFIAGTFFDSITSFMQVLIDPNEFLIVQDRMFASINNVDSDLVLISFIGIGIVLLSMKKLFNYLDVLALGRDNAVNLGVSYDSVVKRLLVVVVVLISIATALVGPLTFLGLLITNIAYEIFKTYQHRYILLGSVFIGIIALVGGQLIVERVFTFSTTVSVIINFVGGIYFIYLLLRGSRT